MLDEHELAIHPYVPESLQHNARVIGNIRSLTASLFGAVAGTLGLESYAGFAFFLFGTFAVSVLLFIARAEQNPKRFFYSPVGELWVGDLSGGVMSFILTWTLFTAMVRS